MGPGSIITRGMGNNASPITRGYGSIFQQIVEVGRQILSGGGMVIRKAVASVQEVLVGAMLLKVNEEPAPPGIQGWIRVTFDTTRNAAVYAVYQFATQVKTTLSNIVIRVRAVKNTAQRKPTK